LFINRKREFGFLFKFGLFLIINLELTTLLPPALIFAPEEYAWRRNQLMDRLGNGVAIFLGAKAPHADYPFYQNNTLMYFWGVEIRGAILEVDEQKEKSLLFFTISERGVEVEGLPRAVEEKEELVKEDELSRHLRRIKFTEPKLWSGNYT